MTQSKAEEEKASNDEETISSEEAVDLEKLGDTKELEPIVELTLEEQVAALEQELQEANSKADEYLDGWLRARAEFSNYKKRIEREQAEGRARVTREIICHYLGVMDDLERALKERPNVVDANAWANGIDLIYKKMESILETEGVEEIQAEGELFDPNLHEAIDQLESEDHDEGTVVEVVQKGYRIGERIIRPAIVRVAM
ncbi:MAG: nucleotide exchange factor GrpE [Anaerolineales bacterium]|nr:nucleotide exchange factor GrpE [Anaerolineales bacterium]